MERADAGIPAGFVNPAGDTRKFSASGAKYTTLAARLFAGSGVENSRCLTDPISTPN